MISNPFDPIENRIVNSVAPSLQPHDNFSDPLFGLDVCTKRTFSQVELTWDDSFDSMELPNFRDEIQEESLQITTFQDQDQGICKIPIDDQSFTNDPIPSWAQFVEPTAVPEKKSSCKRPKVAGSIYVENQRGFIYGQNCERKVTPQLGGHHSNLSNSKLRRNSIVSAGAPLYSGQNFESFYTSCLVRLDRALEKSNNSRQRLLLSTRETMRSRKKYYV